MKELKTIGAKIPTTPEGGNYEHTTEPRVGQSSQVTNNIPKPKVETSKVTFDMISLILAQEGAPEPRAKSQEPRAKNRELRAKSQEPRAES